MKSTNSSTSSGQVYESSKNLPYQKTVFPNGCRLILVPMDGVNSVATSVMVSVGSRYESPKINGISHFLEHMVFKGTKKYPTTDDVNFIERLGGLQNAYTDIDVTNFHNKVLYTDWKEALEINKELALYPRLEAKHVDRERDVILEEMKRYEDEPAIKVGEAFHSLMYPKSALGRRIIGEEKSLRDSDEKTLQAYHQTWYQPSRMVVVITGKIENGELRMENVAKEWFGGLAKKKTEEAETIHETQKTPQVAIVTKPDAQQAHITLGLRTFKRDSDDRFVWNVFNLLFGISFTSRLFREIREKQGLCYAIRSSSDNWVDVGYWSIYAGVATENVKKTVTAILDEMKKVIDKGVTAEEVAVSIKRLKTMLAFKSEDPEFLNEYYGRQELYHQKIITLDEYLTHIESITKKDIDALIKKYIVEKTLNLAVVWNKKEDEGIRKILHL